MNVVSVCSGAGGMDLGFHRAGHRTVALCEVDEWRRRLLAHRWPGVRIWPDLTTLDPRELPRAGILIGGTPCQGLSVAGLRLGLDDPRSVLFWHFVRIRNHLGPKWTVWENVAGALSSDDGLDFASVLGAFVGADVVVPAGGWPGAGVVAGPWGGAVWRVLDAQHFGVPQRRRRVFVVGRLGGPCPPEVLLESAGGHGDSATRRGARQGTASPLEDGTGIARPVSTLQARGSTGGFDVDPAMAAGGHLIVAPIGHQDQSDAAGACPQQLEPGDRGGDARLRGVDGASPDPDGVRAPDGLARRLDGAPVSFAQNQRGEVLEKPIMDSKDGSVVEGFKPDTIHDALHKPTGNKQPFIVGQPDGGDRSALDPLPDGRRYAACGDGVVEPVAEWIGRRLLAVDEGSR